jgi:hypothetical protein
MVMGIYKSVSFKPHGSLKVRELAFFGRKRYNLNCVYSTAHADQFYFELLGVFGHMKNKYPKTFDMVKLNVEIVELLPELEIKPQNILAVNF